MPKISKIYGLGKSQRELDFVDVNTHRDFPVYINPFVFSSRSDDFSIRASRTIRDFFQYNLSLIKMGRISQARGNFFHLNEPNETCLGMSKRRPRGNGMGTQNADKLFTSILNSPAIASGLVEDIEDTAIFIDGIGKDKVSDMTTNIIRNNLITYTQNQCRLNKIPLTSEVPSGFYWDHENKRWDQRLTEMLVIENRKIILIPKGIVSYVKDFNAGKYHRYYALEFLKSDHLNRNTSLVRVSYDKKGNIKRRFVTKADLIEKELPLDKNLLASFTLRHPEVFKDFRTKTAQSQRSITDSELDKTDSREIIDHLIQKLDQIPAGSDSASEFHNLMVGILELLFYPALINPVKEREINDGRKRIDISFDNAGPKDGFFYRLQNVFEVPCQYIFVECKNYSADIKNPEIDQMIGRFSINRGKFGIIVMRTIDNEHLLTQRLVDAYKDGQGLIVPLCDDDIKIMLEKKKDEINEYEKILSNKARLTMS